MIIAPHTKIMFNAIAEPYLWIRYSKQDTKRYNLDLFACMQACISQIIFYRLFKLQSKDAMQIPNYTNLQHNRTVCRSIYIYSGLTTAE